jgi:branched-chain amino acid transport system permease protein
MMANRTLPAGARTALIAAAAVAPLLTNNQYLLSVAVITLLYAYLALSWNILGGIAGQLSLGHAAYFGIGAYASTWLLVHLGLSPWLGMWVGAGIAVIAAVVVGLSCMQLRGAYFALATLATGMVLKTLVENADSLLGGPRGMEVPLLRDAPLYFQHTRKEFYYVVALAFTAVAWLINRQILRSRFGYYLAAVRNDQEAALALGVPIMRYKMLAAMLSAALTALGGTFYAQFVLYISPDKVFGCQPWRGHRGGLHHRRTRHAVGTGHWRAVAASWRGARAHCVGWHGGRRHDAVRPAVDACDPLGATWPDGRSSIAGASAGAGFGPQRPVRGRARHEAARIPWRRQELRRLCGPLTTSTSR